MDPMEIQQTPRSWSFSLSLDLVARVASGMAVYHREQVENAIQT